MLVHEQRTSSNWGRGETEPKRQLTGMLLRKVRGTSKWPAGQKRNLLMSGQKAKNKLQVGPRDESLLDHSGAWITQRSTYAHTPTRHCTKPCLKPGL